MKSSLIKGVCTGFLILIVSAQIAAACKGDAAHNRKFHGDDQCKSCNCVHHHSEHGGLITVKLNQQSIIAAEKPILESKPVSEAEAEK